MPTTVIIELQAEGNEETIETAVKRVLDNGDLQDALHAWAEDCSEGTIEVISCVAHVSEGLSVKAIPGHVIADKIISFYDQFQGFAIAEEGAVMLANEMLDGLSREDALAIARKEARLAGDTRSGITLERAQ